MEIIFEANNVANGKEDNLYAMSNCNGQCSSDSGWCSYNPDSNCWDDGD